MLRTLLRLTDRSFAFAGEIERLFAVVLMATAVAAGATDEGPRIVRPVDKAALKSGVVDIIAGAPEGTLEVDGATIPSERPYPGVLRSKVPLPNGPHKIALVSGDVRKEIGVFVGPNAPSEYAAFHEHPPVPDVACTKCHEVNRRGRFAFKVGCFDCHQQGKFTSVHPPHTVEMLSQCGLCHNAHGSTTKAHLVAAKEVVCKLCHN